MSSDHVSSAPQVAVSERDRSIQRCHLSELQPGDSADAPVVIGVVDSGWDRAIQDARVLQGVGVARTPNGSHFWCEDDQDRIGHGTACTNLIFQIAPQTLVYPIRVFSGTLEASPEALIAAIVHACEKGVRILNLSLGTVREDCVKELYRVCDDAARAGVIVVAAARNGVDRWNYPAVFAPVIGVSISMSGTPLSYSCGVDDAALDFEVAIGSTSVMALGGRTIEARGTSAATAVMTGHIANLIRDHPLADLSTVRLLLRGQGTVRCQTNARRESHDC